MPYDDDIMHPRCVEPEKQVQVPVSKLNLLIKLAQDGEQPLIRFNEDQLYMTLKALEVSQTKCKAIRDILIGLFNE